MFHIIATRTVLPTLKSARENNERPRVPQILFSGEDPQALWHSLVHQVGAILSLANTLALCLNGLPIYVTNDWTYWLVADANI